MFNRGNRAAQERSNVVRTLGYLSIHRLMYVICVEKLQDSAGPLLDSNRIGVPILCYNRLLVVNANVDHE